MAGNKQENDIISRPNKRVLVIGGAGYIGSALLPLLLAKGYQVRILDLLIFGLEPIKPWLNHPQLEIIRGDFRRADIVAHAMQDIDDVVHLGAIVADSACDLDEKITLEVNLMGTKTVAEIAKNLQVDRFIFSSTCSVYGASDNLLDEDSELAPVTLYARTKATSEKNLLKMMDHRFSPVILRLSTVYGLSGRYRFDLVINLLTAMAMVDGEITIFGGNQWRSFVHVEDAARSILAVLDSPAQISRGEVFNVGSTEQNYTISEIGEIIHNYVPSAHIVKNDDLIDPQNYRVNFQKIQRVLKFTPRLKIDQGIQQVIAAIRDGQVKNYKDALFSNIKFYSSIGMNLLDPGKTSNLADFH
jgi:nucleoside-diphosphate-sugar epimerase